MPASGPNGQKKRSLVLVGFMAAGKSKIGRSLAEKLKMDFVDADRLIEQDHGCSVAEIFRQYGEAHFREVERKTILQLIRDKSSVIAVGGGAFVNPQVRRSLIEEAVTIWLDTPFELLLPRLMGSQSRPLASNRSQAELRALFDQRRETYRQAQIHIDTSDANIERIVETIVASLND